MNILGLFTRAPESGDIVTTPVRCRKEAGGPFVTGVAAQIPLSLSRLQPNLVIRVSASREQD